MAALFDRLVEAMDFPIRLDLPWEPAAARLRPPSDLARLRPPSDLTFNFHVFMADEKALSAALGWMGAGSYHPCGICPNILGRIAPDSITDPMFKHYSHQHPDDFMQWTFESFQAAAMELRDVWAVSQARDSHCKNSRDLGDVWNFDFVDFCLSACSGDASS